jgi:hypothetical protein
MHPRITPLLPADKNPVGEGTPHACILGWIGESVYIACSVGMGFYLLSLPWRRFWENNYLLYLYPQIRPVVANPFFKGFVLGLGIVNILIGIHEVVAHIKSFGRQHHFFQ